MFEPLDRTEVHIWLTRDEREIPLADMHTPHIRNAVARLKPWVKALKAERHKKGGDWTEDDAADLGDLQGWLDRFARELKRREKQESVGA